MILILFLNVNSILMFNTKIIVNLILMLNTNIIVNSILMFCVGWAEINGRLRFGAGVI